MSKAQKFVLISMGLLIAIIQLAWIFEEGLHDSRGWYFSLLISSLLLYFGFSKNKPQINFESAEKLLKKEEKVSPNIVSSPIKPSAQEETNDPHKQAEAYFVALEVEIELVKKFLESENIFKPLKGNGNPIEWNATLFVYTSTYIAMIKSKTNLSAMSWNSYKKSLSNLMLDQIGSTDFHHNPKQQEIDSQLRIIESKSNESIKNPDKFNPKPIVSYLIAINGCSEQDKMSSLHIELLLSAERVNVKLLPHIVYGFS